MGEEEADVGRGDVIGAHGIGGAVEGHGVAGMRGRGLAGGQQGQRKGAEEKSGWGA